MEMKQQYKEICERYRRSLTYLCNLTSSYWVADEAGGVLCIDDDGYFLSFDDVRYIVDNDIKLEEVDAWCDYNTRLRMISSDIPTINLESWHKGCPRRSEEEIKELERLYNNSVAAREILEKEIKMFKS